MNKIVYLAVLLFVWTSCTKEPGVSVSVKNTTDLARTLETVEVNWEDIAK